MITEALYNNLLKYAGSLINQGDVTFTNYDLVNEAVVLCNGDYSETTLKKKIIGVLYSERSNRINLESSVVAAGHDGDRQCKLCFDVKPIDFYRPIKRQSFIFFTTYCKDCQSKRSKEIYQQNAEFIKKRSLNYYYQNKEDCKGRNRKYKRDNPEKRDKWTKEQRRQYQRNYYHKNKPEKPLDRINPAAFLKLSEYKKNIDKLFKDIS